MNKLDHICFLGTPDFSVPILDKIVSSFSSSTISVISMPDRPKGRRGTPTPSPVRQYGLTNGLTTYTPENKQLLTQQLQNLSPDLIIVVAYGMILEQVITDTFFCINIHASLLPKYRGASPIHSALINGDQETGNTLIHMNEKMDEGNILLLDSFPIDQNDNLLTLTEKLKQNAAHLIVYFIQNQYLNKSFTETPQDHNAATYTKKITKEELEITSFNNPNQVHNKIRAFSPKPGAYVNHNEKRLKLIQSSLINGQLKLLEVQPEGKAIMTYNDYLLGYPEGFKL